MPCRASCWVGKALSDPPFAPLVRRQTSPPTPFQGHGTQTADRGGDEADGLDEAVQGATLHPPFLRAHRLPLFRRRWCPATSRWQAC